MCLGYGLHCHRAIITLCRLIGIHDMYCKVEGSVNLLNVTRALFKGLSNQVKLCQYAVVPLTYSVISQNHYLALNL